MIKYVFYRVVPSASSNMLVCAYGNKLFKLSSALTTSLTSSIAKRLFLFACAYGNKLIKLSSALPTSLTSSIARCLFLYACAYGNELIKLSLALPISLTSSIARGAYSCVQVQTPAALHRGREPMQIFVPRCAALSGVRSYQLHTLLQLQLHSFVCSASSLA